MSYAIEQRSEERGPVFAVTGAADVRAAEDLAERLSGVSPDAVVDLSASTLVDSRMMALLVKDTERLRGDGGDLVVVCDEPNVLRLFRRMGLDSELTLIENIGQMADPS